MGADATSGIDTCTQATYSGPDDATASVNGTCRDRAGNTSAAFPFNFQYDGTDPTVTATPSRNPDSNGWYNHSLSVGFTGSDAVSGIESCVPPQTYAGPDSANASVSGTCQDHAGNTGSRAFSLSYDGTGPVVTATPSRAPDSNGWYNHVLTVTFSGTDAMSGLDSCVPAQSYSGPDDPTASVNGSCTDTRREHHGASLRAQLRRNRAGGVRKPRPRPRLPRLVQPRAHGDLQRDGCHVRARLLRAAPDLRRPG